jgi:hypothetical protein
MVSGHGNRISKNFEVCLPWKMRRSVVPAFKVSDRAGVIRSVMAVGAVVG